jgi:predicted ATPase
VLSTLAIAGYRSLRDLVIPLQGLTLVTGPNGSGKSSLYRALRLLAETAQGRLVPTLAREGGLTSTLWAGPESFSRSVLRGEHPVQGTRRRSVISLKLGFAGEDFGYAIDLGLPGPDGVAAFPHDPHIKRECVWSGDVLRPSTLLIDRRNTYVRARDRAHEWVDLTQHLSPFDSMMTQCADPRNTPELLLLRESIRGWRFYDQLRTDATSPARSPQIGTHTPVLSSDGADLAAALQTIFEIGEGRDVADTIADAFPGATVSVTNSDGWFDVEMQQHGLLRPLKSAELSDGTLRYLLWTAALLTPRPPALMVLNEPETSLHPDLLPALARLIVRAAERSQLVVVSHAPVLIDALQQQPACHAIMLDKRFGETQISNALDLPRRWQWPSR